MRARTAGFSILAAIGFAAVSAPALADESALQKLADRAEIEELVARYVTALDTLDADAYASVFAENGQFIVGFMGRYEDGLVKRDGRWFIQSRKLASFVQ